ncbi:hypothetical protein QF023_003669 [Chryseobacterium sp. SLBN-27]|uniref:hypothetical protein n=1 Tax=Chryseobacterium sp. SLBN-27 TaxID=3042287 RepID=UPI00285D97EA|nr:hypothetical protein [Chryseobacterium sp. SLBN-27]MDR6160153.1 hypothetical protein [Chryseobacterium sp. SLBN-27]
MSKYTARDIRTLSTEEMFEKRLFSKFRVSDIYVIIGYLQEYFGGYDLDDECVDIFFVNESDKAGIFEKICKKYLRENFLEDDVILRTTETGHSSVLSKTICDHLSKYYTIEEKEFLNHRRFLLNPNDDLFKSPRDLYENDTFNIWNFNQLSFLIGFYIKNLVTKDDIRFLNIANANHKVDMAINFFRDFCDSGDSVKVEYHFNVPCVSNIYFTNGGFLSGFENEVKKYLEFLNNYEF